MTDRPQDEGFLRRWSRLKQEARTQPPADDPPKEAPPGREEASAPPELPPVESLTLDSDFRAFFHPKVEESLRRAALKKLFGDPHFNAMDGLDVYIDDYSVSEPLPEAALSRLEQAKKILAWAQEDARAREQAEARRLRADSERAPAEDGTALLPSGAGTVENAPSPPAPVETARKAE